MTTITLKNKGTEVAMTSTGLKTLAGAALAVAGLTLGIGDVAAQSVVNKIKQRGYVSCGASQGFRDSRGRTRRAIIAASTLTSAAPLRSRSSATRTRSGLSR